MAATTTAVAAGLCGLALTFGANPAAATGAVTPPEAQAIANVGVVQAADLPPGYFAAPGSTAAPDSEGELEFYACLGAGQPQYLARNRSGTFLSSQGLGTPQAVDVAVHSAADVADTEQAAAADQQNLGRTKGARCYEKRLAGHLRAKGLEPKETSVALVPAAVAGAEEAWAYRVRFVVERAGEDVSRNGYVVGSRVGHALLSVSYLVGGASAELSTVVELAAKPVARVRQVQRTRDLS